MQEHRDTIVIYHSPEDGCWVAHSLETDQVGAGERIIDALAGCIRAVSYLLESAASDKTIRVLNRAPQEFWDKVQSSRKLPGEMYEVAHLIALGKWPAENPLNLDSTDGQSISMPAGELCPAA